MSTHQNDAYHTDIPVSPLVTDLYELTMAASYLAEDMFAPATFSLFIRKYPPNRAYFVSAGLADALRYLEEYRFREPDLAYLRSTGLFADDFLDYLSRLELRCDVAAIPEGRLFFTNEPVIEVTGPIIQAQIVESYLLNIFHLQTLIATKASRSVWAAKGRQLVDFALRRTHGDTAGMAVARTSYITGFSATSNVAAGARYGIPISGTMAHSYVQAFPREIDAFRAFARLFPDRTVLLIDTYDTLEGARRAAIVGQEMKARGHQLRAVRIDSGDMIVLSRQVRAILDEANLPEVQIFASGGFDEYAIAEAVAANAPIDAFGVGTRMGVSYDAPATDMAYKLVEYDSKPVLKLSQGKQTLPGRKQVWRVPGADGRHAYDVISLRDEAPPAPAAEPLLVPVMQAGRRLLSDPDLAAARERFRSDFAALDARHKALLEPPPHEVRISPMLARELQEVSRERLRE